MIRSPFFYVGDKYKLMSQLVELFPPNIKTYVGAFTGGGSDFLNVNAERYLANDIDKDLIRLHEEISSYADNGEALFTRVYEIIDTYNLSCSFKGQTTPQSYKEKYPKTYFAKFNKESYVRLRKGFNSDESRDYLKLYILLIYGFNRMLRFNRSGEFNLPVGNVDFNKNVVDALNNYLSFMKENEVSFSCNNYIDFINKQELGGDDFVYIDPPYLISASEYNKLWDNKQEVELYELLDELNRKGIKFGLSNMLEHKGMKNSILEKWSKKYKVHEIKSNYISFNNNSIKTTSREVYVTNYEQ
ncbi:MAG: DNA adenine methylase [Chloroflexi bacterium]|nr:DNA adenine methylase [Chloroflexota bacterium]|tara:strand:+ start:2676 stop:3578 length:903 start_codon:yes stop_codon:yes gene_type:complete